MMERQNMNSEVEAEGRVKALPYKVRAASKESQAQRASQILDSDLRTHWSTSTNAKEWILLELEETCLLSHIRIHNKSVLEWEISIGLRNKPDTFLKVRPRCEAPRRDITYNIGYLPCRYVRITCLRGNPIAIFYAQLMGISVPGLEPELQPVVDHFLPQIISRIKEPHDMQLQLLQDISLRLSPFLQQLEVELSVPSEAMDSSIRFLAMLVGPFYPFLALFKAVRDTEKLVAAGGADEELSKGSLASVFTVSSNFQAPPKRIRSPGLSVQTTGQSLALRPNSVMLLMRVAYKDMSLNILCRKVARLLRKLSLLNSESALLATEGSAVGVEDNVAVNDTPPMRPADYTKLFGEDFRIPDDDTLEIGSASMIDIPLVEEALLHVLYGCATQPLICRRLADAKSDLSPVLPLLRSLLPALRPPSSTAPNADVVDETFWQWQMPVVQRALNQVVAMATAPSYRPLLDACAGYLSAYSPVHEKSACVLIDLCAGPLAPWLAMIIAKVDLAVELLEDLLGIIQAGQQAPTQARAVLVYMLLALSGHVDDVLPQYKNVKHKVLFVIEMLEPYLIPAIMPVKSTIAFGDVSAVVLEKHEKTCSLALELLQTALQKPSVLPAMEAEWRRGQVAPSVLLSILAPHVALPPGIDLLKCRRERAGPSEVSPVPDGQSVINFGTTAEASVGPMSVAEGAIKGETNEDANLLFAPLELKGLALLSLSSQSEGTLSEDKAFLDVLAKMERKSGKKLLFDLRSDEHEWDLRSEYWQLVNSPERELRASEFIRFASELHMRQDESTESQQSAIDALLLAAECHVNPFFMISSSEYQNLVSKSENEFPINPDIESSKKTPGLDMLAWLEEERDKAVLNILMRAAEWGSVGSIDDKSTKGEEGFGDPDECSCRIEIDEEDSKIEDAVTLVRQRQGLLCQFLVQQLQRDRHNLYEVLLQGLLFVLQSATKLSSPPEDIIDVILACATRLNASLVAYHNQGSHGVLSQGPGTFHSVRRQWVLLRKLVLVASGGRPLEGGSSTIYPEVNQLHQDLIPGWAWMSRIPKFSGSTYPLVRYIVWLGVSQFAHFQSKSARPLVADIQDLTNLLLIFSDELVSIELLKYKESSEERPVVQASLEAANMVSTAEELEQVDPGSLAKVLYPEFSRVFPRLRVEFSQFADTLLQSICSQIEAVPCSFIPDMLSWFSDVCYNPFPGRHDRESQGLGMKGFTVGNAQYVIMRLLEVIILEHMEAILPELTRVFQVLVSLCSSSYCDVPLLEAVLKALKPIISHATSSSTAYEGEMSVEILSYETIMQQLSKALDNTHQRTGVKSSLCLFLCGFLLSSLSTTKCNKVLTKLKSWVESTNFGSSASGSVLDNLSAFHKILDECLNLLKGMASDDIVHPTYKSDVSPQQGLHSLLDSSKPLVLVTPESEVSDFSVVGDVTEASLGEEVEVSLANGEIDDKEILEKSEGSDSAGNTHVQQAQNSSDKLEFGQNVRDLVLALGPGLEIARNLHPQLATVVILGAARCLHHAGDCQPAIAKSDAERQFLKPSVKALAASILSFQKIHCWQVASTAMEYLLSLPSTMDAHEDICMILTYQCTHAPRVTWRLLPTQWIVKAFPYKSLAGSSELLIQLLCTMLEHPEPEQHAGALRQLEKVVDDEENNIKSATREAGCGGPDQRTVVETFVSAMWVPVMTAATTHKSADLKNRALAVLIKMVPFAESTQLQSLMSSIDIVFKTEPLTPLGLSLLAQACLYSSAADLDIIPSRTWSRIQSLAQSKAGGKFVEVEREICRALVQLHSEGEGAKEHTRQVLTSVSEKPVPDPSFTPVREAVVEVLARLSVLRSKADDSISTAVQEAAELEEAEIELELMREEVTTRGGGGETLSHVLSLTATAGSAKDRLKQLRAQIIAEEHLATRAEIAARREKQRIARRKRQIALEEATLRETTLRQELEKERAAEAERELERQRILEKERAKTRELRHSLDLEAEKRSQREYQRELEQRETGVVRTTSRREFASNTTPSSRPRDRYRERPGQEGPSRPNTETGATTPPATPTAAAAAATHTVTAPAPTPAPTPTLNTTNSRMYSGHSSGLGRENVRDRDRDRSNERGAYEDAGEGNGAPSRDSATDVGNFNEDGVSGMDGGNAGTLGSGHRQGPRSSRPRAVVERRERDGRREGKWERKQT